jgi:N-acetylneuraminic acid mutarotase
VILFGGDNEHRWKKFDDTWALDLATNTWTELYPDTHPSKRGWHAMVYNSKAEQVILFGGGRSRTRFTDETWIYDPAANTWTSVAPSP